MRSGLLQCFLIASIEEDLPSHSVQVSGLAGAGSKCCLAHEAGRHCCGLPVLRCRREQNCSVSSSGCKNSHLEAQFISLTRGTAQMLCCHVFDVPTTILLSLLAGKIIIESFFLEPAWLYVQSVQCLSQQSDQ